MGTSGRVHAQVTHEPLSVAEHEAAVARSAAGAVVSFAGVVRDHDHGRHVVELEYVGHPSANDVLLEIAEKLAAEGEIQAVAVSHRLGVLEIGDVALACAVSCAHRRDAFEACARLVDEVKANLPVWKHQKFADGTDEWVDCP